MGINVASKNLPRKTQLHLAPAAATLGLDGSVPIVLIRMVEPEAVRRPLRLAVRAAVKAYKKSGRMLDAALAYAAHGYPVFPLTKDKKPVPRRDRDANGKEIPGTGGFKKEHMRPGPDPQMVGPERISGWHADGRVDRRLVPRCRYQRRPRRRRRRVGKDCHAARDDRHA
jgi:hypothetical protein